MNEQTSSVQLLEQTCTVPITALKYCDNHLICGEGPNVSVYDCEIHSKLLTQRIFEYERIHGIVTNELLEHGPSDEGKFCAVFGGKSCCILLICKEKSKLNLRRTVQHTFCDWIWTVQWLQENQIAVALGHNAICLWNWKENKILTTVHCKDKCILYSAHFIGNTWNDLILAAGTVFNQVVLWDANSTTNAEGRNPVLHRLPGHTGVIFSVKYNANTKELCSVSDDRSIIIWKVEFQIKPGECMWQSASFSQKHRLFGHSARVWDVRLLKSGCVVSIGEDSTCIVWDRMGQIVQKLKGHRGKSIWSLDVNPDETMVATGGGDCGIRVWKLPLATHSKLENKSKGNSEEERLAEGSGQVQSSTIRPDDCVQFFPRIVRLFDRRRIAVMSDDGTLHDYNLETCRWNTLLCDTRYNSYSVVETSHNHRFIAVGSIYGMFTVIDTDGNTASRKMYDGKVFSITWMDTDVTGVATVYPVLTTGPEGKMNLSHIKEDSAGTITLAAAQSFTLPAGKQRWVAAGCMVQHEGLQICGDRGGSIHVYQLNNQDALDPIQSFWKVHGKAGVTDICYHDNHVYTSGRDGCYRQYSIDDGQLNLLNSSKALKGLEWISRLVFKDGDFQVLGFHTNNFVVHSVDRNQTLMCFPCGGGHRAWDFFYGDNRSVFVHIKSREVVVSQCKYADRQNKVLKESLHGRELTCIRHIHSTVDSDICVSASEDTFLNIVAFAGSECKVLHRLHGHISSVRALAVATSNSNQGCTSYMLFSGGGRAQMKAWKVHIAEDRSAGASAVSGLLSWNVWYEQLGTHMLGYKGRKHSKPWKKHLYNVSPETRYMDLTTFQASQVVPGIASFHVVAAACSDGYVRLLVYNEDKRDFSVIGQSDFHDHCVLSVKRVMVDLPFETPEKNTATQKRCYICSAATDGKLVFWDITQILFHAFRDSAKNLVSNSDGAKVNCDSKCDMEGTETENTVRVPAAGDGVHSFVDPLLIISCHQSGINALDIFHLKGSDYLVASGGDDNCLCLHAVTLNGTSSKCSYSMKVPSAHSTQITGVKVLGEDHIISTSIDQRLSVWKTDHVLQTMSLLGCKFINVADVSSIDVWATENSNYKVAVAGVGVQTLKVSLTS